MLQPVSPVLAPAKDRRHQGWLDRFDFTSGEMPMLTWPGIKPVNNRRLPQNEQMAAENVTSAGISVSWIQGELTMMPNIFHKSISRFFIALLVYNLGGQSVYAQAQNVTEPAGARVLETGVLKNLPGFTDDVLGAEVKAVTPAENDTQVIDIVIPVDPDEVDRISVLTPGGKPLKRKRAMEISMDHENKEVGVILTLSRKDQLGFKFRLIDLPDDQQ